MGTPNQQRNRRTRQEKAAATRQRIRQAALDLFTERGYAATSIANIAEQAEVATQTIYFTFGTKLALLKELLDVSVAGDEAPTPTLQRPWVTDAIASAEPTEHIRQQVQAACEIVDRVDPVLQILHGAAAADPDAAALWRTNREQLRTVQRHLIQALADKDGLRDDLDVDTATDIAYAIIGTDVYHVLVAERGWSPQQWQQWAAELLIQQLVPR